MERLQVEHEGSTRRALILALGEYPGDRIPLEDRRALLPTLLAWYDDHPDPGLHGSVDWLLRQKWDQAQELDRIDAERADGAVPKDREGYVNRQGHTFTVVRGPVEFLMGSPDSEAERYPEEIQHWVRIPRSFAIAARPVTVVQYEHFLAQNPDVASFLEHPEAQPYIPSPSCQMVKVNWYEAAKYCNWLSGQEGIPQSQWCYPTQVEPGMAMPADYLSRTGYRLPTEAEWEYACRANSLAARFYGNSTELLPRFGWYEDNAGNQVHPPGQLKPNDLGLFDMLGNAYDWLQDPHEEYQPGTKERPVIDTEKPGEFSDSVQRVLRGGAFLAYARLLRSAARIKNPPTDRFLFEMGLRPARSLS